MLGKGVETLGAGEYLAETTDGRKARLKLNQSLSCVGRSGHGIRVHQCNGGAVRGERGAEQRKLLAPLGNIVVAGEERAQATRIRNGGGHLGQSLSGVGRIGDSAGVDPRHGFGEGFHGCAEVGELGTPIAEIIVTGEEGGKATGVRNGLRHLGKGLACGRGVGHHVRVDTSHRIGELLHGFAEGNELGAPRPQIVLTHDLAQQTALVRNVLGELGESLGRSGGRLDRAGVDSGDRGGVHLHGQAEGNKLLCKGCQIVLTGKLGEKAALVRNVLGELGKSLCGGRRSGDRSRIDADHSLGICPHVRGELRDLLAELHHGGSAGEPAGRGVDKTGSGDHEHCGDERFDAFHRGRIDALDAVEERLGVPHEVGQTLTKTGKGRGHTGHGAPDDASDDAAEEPSDGLANGLEERLALADQPLRAGNLGDGAHGGHDRGHTRDDDRHGGHALDRAGNRHVTKDEQGGTCGKQHFGQRGGGLKGGSGFELAQLLDHRSDSGDDQGHDRDLGHGLDAEVGKGLHCGGQREQRTDDAGQPGDSGSQLLAGKFRKLLNRIDHCGKANAEHRDRSAHDGQCSGRLEDLAGHGAKSLRRDTDDGERRGECDQRLRYRADAHVTERLQRTGHHGQRQRNEQHRSGSAHGALKLPGRDDQHGHATGQSQQSGADLPDGQLTEIRDGIGETLQRERHDRESRRLLEHILRHLVHSGQHDCQTATYADEALADLLPRKLGHDLCGFGERLHRLSDGEEAAGHLDKVTGLAEQLRQGNGLQNEAANRGETLADGGGIDLVVDRHRLADSLHCLGQRDKRGGHHHDVTDLELAHRLLEYGDDGHETDERSSGLAHGGQIDVLVGLHGRGERLDGEAEREQGHGGLNEVLGALAHQLHGGDHDAGGSGDAGQTSSQFLPRQGGHGLQGIAEQRDCRREDYQFERGLAKALHLPHELGNADENAGHGTDSDDALEDSFPGQRGHDLHGVGEQANRRGERHHGDRDLLNGLRQVVELLDTLEVSGHLLQDGQHADAGAAHDDQTSGETAERRSEPVDRDLGQGLEREGEDADGSRDLQNGVGLDAGLHGAQGLGGLVEHLDEAVADLGEPIEHLVDLVEDPGSGFDLLLGSGEEAVDVGEDHCEQ